MSIESQIGEALGFLILFVVTLAFILKTAADGLLKDIEKLEQEIKDIRKIRKELYLRENLDHYE